MKARVLVVEDDYLQAEWMQSTLSEALPGLQTERIATEYEFRCKVNSLTSAPPDVILLDVMLRWCDPDQDVKAPDDVRLGGFYRAGLRCEKLLRANTETSSVSVILYTVLEERDLESELKKLSIYTIYIPKDSTSTQLVAAVREALKRTQRH